MAEKSKYEVVVTIDEMKEQKEESCAFIAQGITYRFKQNDFRKREGLPNLAKKFRVGSHVRLTVHDFSPEGKDFTQHWVDHAEKVADNVPNSREAQAGKRSGGGGRSHKTDFDPNLSARQTSAHVAGVLTTLSPPENPSEATVWPIFEGYAQKVLSFLLESSAATVIQAAAEKLDATIIPDDIDPAYEAARDEEAEGFFEQKDTPDDDDIPF